MASVTGFTAERMLAIEKSSVVGGFVNEAGQLVLVNQEGEEFISGVVEGPRGVQGLPGAAGETRYTWIKYADTPASGMSDDPAGKKYLGLAYNKLSSIESPEYDDYSWTLVQGTDGVRGPAGADGSTLYTWIKYGVDDEGGGISDIPTGKTYIGLAYNKTTAVESSDPADYRWALIKGDTGPSGPQGVQGLQGPDGLPRYTWIKYADTPTTGMSDDSTGKKYLGLAYNKLSNTESETYSDYLWSLIQGVQGVQGPIGPNGQATYTWIKYASSGTGAGMTDLPAGMPYIGIAYNKTTQTESTDPSLYKWSLVKGDPGNTGPAGPQGVPGPAGADGLPRYTWVKYADTPLTGMSDDPTNKKYIGFAFNQFLSTESSNYGDYQWSLTQGIQGVKGDPGVIGPKGPDGATLYTWIKYGSSAAGAGLTDDPTGMSYIGVAYNKGTTVESTVATDYVWSLIKGATGATGAPGVAGPAGADGTPRYTWIKYADTPTTGMNDDPTGKSYMGIAYNKTTTVESVVYSDYEWTLVKGAPGNTGVAGPAGPNGATLYTWIKYATTSTGGGISDDPTNMLYMGIAYNKTTATESTVTTDYEWSLIKGATGSQGIQGPIGPNGAPTYTWLKYADTPTTGMNDDPTGKKYLGLAYNKTTATESSVYTDYTWSLIQGPQGSQGIAGAVGPDGATLYTWLKYGNTALGGGMSDSPTNMTYIGLAYNKTSSTESNIATDYTWSLIQGPQGPTGATGATGATGTAGAAGLSITSAAFYYKVTSDVAAAPAVPTTNPPDGTWTATEPTYAPNTALWTVFRVQYANSTFVYSAVSKSSSYKAAYDAMNTASGKSKVTYATAAPSGTGTLLGDIWFRIGGNLIIGMWIWNGTIWENQVISESVIGELSAGKIVTGFLDAARLNAQTITSQKLIVGDFTNLFANAQWRQGALGWQNSAGVTYVTESTISKARLAPVASQVVSLRPTAFVPVQPGEKFYIEAYIEKSTGFTVGEAGIGLAHLNPSTLVEQDWDIALSVDLKTQASGVYSALIEIPTNGTIQQIRPYLYLSSNAVGGTYVKFQNLQWRRMSTGELIVEGSLTADKLDAAEIWSAQAWIDVLKTRVITTEMVSSDFGASISLDQNGSVTILTGATNAAKTVADRADSNATDALAKVKDTADDITALGQFYRFTTASAIIGKVGDPTELRLQNDEIGIYQSGQRVSWWNAGTFNVISLVGDEAKIGNHKIEKFGTDRTIFRKV